MTIENQIWNTLILLAFIVFVTANSDLSANQSQVETTTYSPVVNNTTQSSGSNVLSQESKAISASNSSTKYLPISIYYEALCKDSVDFMEKQFTPVYITLSEFMSVNFIPFAQGEINGTNATNANIICHRKENECNADKVHTCAIDKIKDTKNLVKFITCALVEGYQNKTVPISKCGKNSNITNEIIDDIEKCSNSSLEWFPLLKNDSEVSKKFSIKFVPTVIFNETYSEDNYNRSLTNFLQVVCENISEKNVSVCKGSVSGSDAVVVGLLPILLSVYYLLIKLY